MTPAISQPFCLRPPTRDISTQNDNIKHDIATNHPFTHQISMEHPATLLRTRHTLLPRVSSRAAALPRVSSRAAALPLLCGDWSTDRFHSRKGPPVSLSMHLMRFDRNCTTIPQHKSGTRPVYQHAHSCPTPCYILRQRFAHNTGLAARTSIMQVQSCACRPVHSSLLRRSQTPPTQTTKPQLLTPVPPPTASRRPRTKTRALESRNLSTEYPAVQQSQRYLRLFTTAHRVCAARLFC
jgi:hypothetical protein